MPLWMVEDILIIDTGFLHYHNDKFQKETMWDGWELQDLAQKDGIVPPTGEALRDAA